MSLSAICVLSLSFFAVYGQNEPVFFNTCPAETRERWSYRGLNGPMFWGVTYRNCYGRQQSPIALRSSDAVEDGNLDQLALNHYDKPLTKATIENNGHTIEVTPDDGVSRTISVNGGEYSLRQFHFHWGDAKNKGSEHTLDGIQYAMEMHLVHTNENDQIAVVGIFIQEEDDNNEEFQKLVNELSNVKYKDDEEEIQPNIILNNLLPANPLSYYRYQGSLTTPPCSEGVTWSVAKDPIKVGKSQLDVFRKQLYSVKKEDAKDSCKLVNNYRPLQLLLGREVLVSK